jgi:hypothetical protein
MVSKNIKTVRGLCPNLEEGERLLGWVVMVAKLNSFAPQDCVRSKTTQGLMDFSHMRKP